MKEDDGMKGRKEGLRICATGERQVGGRRNKRGKRGNQNRGKRRT